MEQLLQEIPVSENIRILVGLASILLLTVFASVILRSVVFRLIGRLTAGTSTSLDDRLLTATRTHSALLVYIFGISLFFDYLHQSFPEYVSVDLAAVIDALIYSFGVVVVAILMVRVVSALLGWYVDTVASTTETTLDDEFVPLLDRTVKIVIVTLATLIILDHFDVDVKGLVAVLGVGSLAVALAAQDTLANMIGGFTIMIDRPFRVGDMIKLPDDRRAIVHEIGIRSTKFLTSDNTLVIVPNAELIKSTIHNITYPKPMVRLQINVGVDYGSDMELVSRLMLAEAAKHSQILESPKPQFLFLDFGDSSLNVSLRCYVGRAEDYRVTSSELRLEILESFRSAGIEIPFPQRVITMVDNQPSDESPPGDES